MSGLSYSLKPVPGGLVLEIDPPGQPIPYGIAAMIARDLIVAVVDDLVGRRPTTVGDSIPAAPAALKGE